MRPRVDYVVDMPQEEVLGRLQERFRQAEAPVEGTILARHVDLLIPERERHYWSPWLSFDVDPAERGCRIQGKFGPHPHVWTLFLALYALLTCAGIAGAMYGLAQLTLGSNPWALWAVPAAGLLAVGVYLLALTGKRLGAEQMGLMRTFLCETLPELHPPAAEAVELAQGEGRGDAAVSEPVALPNGG